MTTKAVLGQRSRCLAREANHTRGPQFARRSQARRRAQFGDHESLLLPFQAAVARRQRLLKSRIESMWRASASRRHRCIPEGSHSRRAAPSGHVPSATASALKARLHSDSSEPKALSSRRGPCTAARPEEYGWASAITGGKARHITALRFKPCGRQNDQIRVPTPTRFPDEAGQLLHRCRRPCQATENHEAQQR